MYKILVTGIGGNVGEGILRNIKAFIPACMIVGLDVSDFCVGSRYCDVFYKVPYSTDIENYKNTIIAICEKEKPDLIIPSTDYETYYLNFIENLPKVICSNSNTTSICLDKYKTFLFFKENNMPFANTSLVSQYSSQWENIIVKPREGRGSRNIFINPKDLSVYDDSYIVQPQLIGPEITTAFYVTKENSLHGEITFLRTLKEGMTNKAEVTFDYREQVNQLLVKLIGLLPITGPCNIQSIVVDGAIVPFEINCRYSGTNSIRSQFGFEDVRYGIEEYLLNISPTKPNIIPGVAFRTTMDVIYKYNSLSNLTENSTNQFSYIY